MNHLWTAAFILLAVAVPRPATADCKVVHAATIKMVHTPHKITTTSVLRNSKSRRAITIQTANTIYLRMDGDAWSVVPHRPGENDAVLDRMIERENKDCTLTGQEMVGGQMTEVYAVESSEFDTWTRKWISPKLGLPLKIETHVGSTPVTVGLIEYKDILPPADLSRSKN
jgi:hypothetical protein